MDGSDDFGDREEESKTGARAGINVDSRRRSVLKAAGAGLGLSALGGSAVGTAGASHDSTTFQVDLVNSTPGNLKDPLDETGNYYSDDSTLVRWVWGDDQQNTAEGGMTKYDGGTFDGATVTTQNGVNIDFNTNTASVEFSVSGGTVDLCLVSYSAPSGASLGWDASDASGQRIYDLDYGTFGSEGSLSVAVPIKANAVTNHSVESGDLSGDSPDDWTATDWSGNTSLTYVDSESRTGSRSLKAEATDSADSQWEQTGIPVDPLHAYEASGWLKSQNVTKEDANNAVFFQVGSVDTGDQELTGTNPWTYQETRFRPLSDSVGFRYRHGAQGTVTGTAWFDDAVVRKVIGEDPEFGLEAKYTLDGSTATNSVTGKDATVTGSPDTDVTGKVNGAFGFTKNDDRSSTADALESADPLPLDESGATVGVWFRYTAKEKYARVFQVGGGTGGTSQAYEVIFDNANDSLYVAGISTDTGTISVEPDTWYFVVFVGNGSDVRLHVFDRSGELDASPATGERSPSNNDYKLVMMSGDDSEPAGRLDEVRAYSRAFTESEVWRLYQGTLDLQSDRRVYYSLDNSTATNADTGTDAIENGSPTSGQTGILNNAFSFDSANTDGLKSGDPVALNGKQATVGAWINFTGHDDYGRIYQIGGDFASIPNSGWQTRFNGSNDDLAIETRGGGLSEYVLTDPLKDDTWYFVVTVLDEPGGEARIHVYDQSGELSNSPYSTSLGDPSWSQTGYEQLVLMTGGKGEGTSGRMDEVYGYASALSESEVDTLYNDSTSS
jgi:hypothetical protein